MLYVVAPQDHQRIFRDLEAFFLDLQSSLSILRALNMAPDNESQIFSDRMI